MKANKLSKTTIATLIGAAIIAGSATAHAAPTPKKLEKCYGIVKAGENQCGNSRHACAGKAKKNSMGDEWMYVLKGNCKMIAGGTLKPKS